MEKCHKCGRDDVKLIHHHKSYEPEVIVMMCRSCHEKLHVQLRKEGTCQIPVDELGKICRELYHHNNYQKFDFYETMMLYVGFYEQIKYNHKTGTVTYSANFKASNGKELYYVDVE